MISRSSSLFDRLVLGFSAGALVVVTTGPIEAAENTPRDCAKGFSALYENYDFITQPPRPGKVSTTFLGKSWINNIRITGDDFYPLALVRGNLGLTDRYLVRLPKNAKILSVGEGISELAPYLHKDFPNVRAVDLWYDQTDLPLKLQEYVKRNRSLLTSGNATQLPIESRSIDLVVSHMLINNVAGDDRTVGRMIQEMVRVLAPQGEARIASKVRFEPETLEVLRRRYPEYSISIEPFDAQYISEGTPEHIHGDRLIIKNNSLF